MNKNKTLFIMLIISLVMVGLACRLPGGNANSSVTIPVTTEAVDELEANLEQAAEALQSGEPFTLTITEAQLTSIASMELQAIEGAQIDNLQIYLQDGQIQAYGDVNQDGFTLPVGIGINLSTNAQGQIEYDVVQASIGPFPIPESALSQITDQMDQVIMQQIDPNHSYIFLDQITIANGVMTIIGHAQ